MEWWLLGRWSELEWRLLGLWRSVLHRWVWIADISRRKEKGKKRKARKGKDDEGKGGKPGDGKGQSNNVQPQTSSTPALQNRQQQAYCSSAASSSGHGFLCICWDWSCARGCFDSHLWRARVQETYTSGGQKPTWCSGMANQRRKWEVSCFGWRSWSSSISSTTATSACPEQFADWRGFMEAIGERHFLIYAWILRKTWRYHCSLNTLQNQRKQLGIRVLFLILCHASLFLACENGLAFTQRILHHQMYVPLTLDAQELWAPERQFEAFCRYVDIYYMYIICILYVYYMYTICILYVYYMYIMCTLYVCYIFTCIS